MPSFRRPKEQPQPNDRDADLASFYTNTEQAFQSLEKIISAPSLPKRLLVILGLGGVGKSTLLKMFRLRLRQRIPMALISSDEVPSPVDILSHWAEDLSLNEVTLPSFQKTLRSFRAIQRKVEDKAQSSTLASEAGKAVTRAVIGLASNAIPIVGPVINTIGSVSSDAFIDWLRGFLNKTDLELYIDPIKQLSADFLKDLGKVAARQRLVLAIDTYEKMTTLDRWMRELVQALPKNVLFILASRAIPQWDRDWPGWIGSAEIIELQEMSIENLRTLVSRYYTFIRGGEPDPQQVDAIIQFARGLPMVATTVVRLWVQYHVEDFQAVRPRVVADLVDRLLEGVPQNMRPAFEVAAVLRYFTVDSLNALLDDGQAETVYQELRQWPFILSRREGLAVHDTMREMINDALYVRSSERFRTLQERAAMYYGRRGEKTLGEERERFTVEQLYHLVRADETTGIKLFRERAEDLTRNGLVDQLRTLLNEVNTYPLQQENSRLWVKYYEARLKDLVIDQADAVRTYQEIADNKQAEDLLRAYALIDWAWLERSSSFSKLAEILERVHTLFPRPETLPEPDVKLGLYLIELGELYKVQGKGTQALTYLEQARTLYERAHDFFWLAFTYNRMKYYYLERGAWREALQMHELGLQEAAKLPVELGTTIKAELLGGYTTYWMWAGRLYLTEIQLREAVALSEKAERVEQSSYLRRDLALDLGLQGKLQESEQVFARVIEIGQPYDSSFEAVTDGLQGMVALKWKGAAEAEPLIISIMQVFRQETSKIWYFPPLLNVLGTLYEMKGDMALAEQFYQERLKLSYLEQWYWHVGSLAGMVRIYTATDNLARIVSIVHEAEILAEQYEFYDHLASIRLMQGHLIWDGKVEAWGQGFDAALHFYQQALVNALRHNRFTLDEVLKGLEHETPLYPIIPACLQRGEEGQRMLKSLYDWWQSGTNNTDRQRTDTFSPIPEGSLLMEVERLARQQEPGNGSIQKTVLDYLNQALGNKTNKAL